MIFITVGTTRFPFVRMARVVQGVVRTRTRKEKVIFQYGATDVEMLRTLPVILVSSLSYRVMQQYMKKSRIIICHGGPATIYQALSYRKKPWVLPREKHYGEHVDDHQHIFSKYLEKKKYIKLITNNRDDVVQMKKSAWRLSPNKSLNKFMDYLSHNVV